MNVISSCHQTHLLFTMHAIHSSLDLKELVLYVTLGNTTFLLFHLPIWKLQKTDSRVIVFVLKLNKVFNIPWPFVVILHIVTIKWLLKMTKQWINLMSFDGKETKMTIGIAVVWTIYYICFTVHKTRIGIEHSVFSLWTLSPITHVFHSCDTSKSWKTLRKFY